MEAGSSLLTLGKIPSTLSYSVKLRLLHSRRVAHWGAVLVWAQAGCQVPTLGWKTPAKSSFTAVILSRPTGHRSCQLPQSVTPVHLSMGRELSALPQKDAYLPGAVTCFRPGHPWGTVLCAQSRDPSAGPAVMPHPRLHTDIVWLRATEKELT